MTIELITNQDVYLPRLDLLIDKVTEWKAAERKVEMRRWVTKSSRNRCNTVCCVCGHAGLDPDFQALGFVTWFEDSGNSVIGSGVMWQGEGEPRGAGYVAASWLLGLVHREEEWCAELQHIFDDVCNAGENQYHEAFQEDGWVAEWLFAPGSYRTESSDATWAEVLRRLKMLRAAVTK